VIFRKEAAYGARYVVMVARRSYQSHCSPVALGVFALRRNAMLTTLLLIVLILLVVGSLPTYPYSRDWGYYPSGGVGLVLLILLILMLMGRI
jgi:hypothetical protein